MIPTINFHLIKACNYTCKFCYATFDDIHSKGLTQAEQMELITLLSVYGKFRKINFAGGEPTLVPHIQSLIIHAKKMGFETSIVTNASKIDYKWIEEMKHHLDILTLSIDSDNADTNQSIGRISNKKMICHDKLYSIATACHKSGIHLKINTVVSAFNQQETLYPLINTLKPFRWKILQVTPIEGQNETQFQSVKVEDDAFEAYCERNKPHTCEGIKVVIESAKNIQGSYLMIDLLGRFYDSNSGKHNYSSKILAVGVEKSLEEIQIDMEKFYAREGDYTTLLPILS